MWRNFNLDVDGSPVVLTAVLAGSTGLDAIISFPTSTAAVLSLSGPSIVRAALSPPMTQEQVLDEHIRNAQASEPLKEDVRRRIANGTAG